MADNRPSGKPRNNRLAVIAVIVLGIVFLIWGFGYFFGPIMTDELAPTAEEVPMSQQPDEEFAADEDTEPAPGEAPPAPPAGN